MFKINWFKASFLLISFFITILLIGAILSLFMVPNFKEIWTNLLTSEMIFSLKLSLTTSLISSLLVMFFALPIGYTLSRFEFWGKTLVKTICDLPVAFPELVLGLCLLLLFGNTGFGSMLQKLGLNFVFTKQGIVAAQFFTALPYAIRIMKSTFDFINPRLEFVSRSLGYTQYETFINVSLPLAKSGIIASSVISFARCIGTFGTVLILAGGSYMQTEVLPITLYLNISYGNMGMAITSGIVLVIISFLAIFIFEKAEVSL
ncbi:molybdate transport system permease protein [Desulfonauticus submarinus]|uniref:Molybdate transport system permease protein n=1 Tax=Desulfonauticus submarinus TaxID=206665 RepID=A0A1H0FH49_9BACT|nr:ABC transporter permease [Desulfonauticus submarinus]SDN93936.1 molybdate transport system permease protein [Desulfonauticus submarinus]